MVPILSFVGESNSGKTTIIQKIISELKNRGYRIASFKHTHHNFSLDKEGKDSFLHRQAGAEATLLIGKNEYVLQADLQEKDHIRKLCNRFFPNFDLIVGEGFKNESIPKIEVIKETPLLSEEDPYLHAYIFSKKKSKKKPTFDTIDIKEICNFIEENFLKKRKQVEKVELFVDGKSIPLNPFVKGFIQKSILGMVASLKGTESLEDLQIRIRKG